MDERTTGATNEQMVDGVRRFYENWGKYPGPTAEQFTFTANNEYMTITEAAEFLVPPGYRIVTPDDLAAIRRAWRFLGAIQRWDTAPNDPDAVDEHAYASAEFTDDDLARLAALTGEAGT